MRKAIEILRNSPLSLEALRSWIRTDLSEHFKEQEEQARANNPDFEKIKEVWVAEQLQINELALVMENNSPYLFNFFDTHNLFIKIDIGLSSVSETVPLFIYFILDEKMNNTNSLKWYSTRREASFVAIDEAFKLLENKLGL